MKPEFIGRALSTDEILDMLQSQGLRIDDRNRAEHILQNVSYTRLKNYLVALMENRSEHRFRPGASFEDAYALYGFDRRLRELIFHEMEKIEISIRTHMANASNGKERGYWFMNPTHFRSKKSHEKILKKIKTELDRSDNEAIKNFYSKYSNEFPPSWLMLEATSMGTLFIMYHEISDMEIKNRISNYYGLPPETFESWIRHLVEMRNDCAHHNRVWNSRPTCPADLPLWTRDPFPDLQEDDRDHVYFTLCIIKYLQNTVKPTNTFAMRLKVLINNFKMISPSKMGFPDDWENDEFWK